MEKYQEMQMQNQENTREILKETARGNQDLVNKVIDVIPKMGNTTTHNTTNNTLNFYLTNTCKDAESSHDFTDRYVKRCTDFFIENYRNIANKQICLATNVYNIMFMCLEENPQYMNFIQTTDIKNGVHYVKEKKKDENRQLYGEAEFIKYVDSFYGQGGVYDMRATPGQIIEPTGAMLNLEGWDCAWDSVDREKVRDIMIERFGLKFPGE